jgi:hypothetical protein
LADVGGTANTGAIYVWAGGGGTLTGLPGVLSVTGAATSDQLGQ